MKTRRNLIPIWLLCVLALPAEVQAQFTFTTNNDAITITRYTGITNATAMIPDTTNGYPVVSIGIGVFYESLSLTNVTIPDSVINMGWVHSVNASA